MMTDPVADMLTRIRNANAIERPAVELAASKLKVAIAQVLKAEGFILDYQVGTYVKDESGYEEFQSVEDVKAAKKPILRVFLKYSAEGEKVIRQIDRASKPGRRLYRPCNRLPRVLDGLGIAVVSTSRGVLSDRKARELGVGGEIICTVW